MQDFQRSRRNLGPRLKIVVSPVRVRVSPSLQVLQTPDFPVVPGKRKTTRNAAGGLFRPFPRKRSSPSCRVAWEERPADLCGRLAHRELPAATDLAALTALEHIPVDAVRSRHVLVADLGSNVVLVGAGGEQGRNAGVPQPCGA